PICASVLEAGQEIGLEYREDVNDLPPGHKDCIGWCQQTRGGRRRASAARTYLHPVLKRPNLQLVTNAMVHRVVFDGTRATGVEFSRGGPGGAVERAEAGREVILSAGGGRGAAARPLTRGRAGRHRRAYRTAPARTT